MDGEPGLVVAGPGADGRHLADGVNARHPAPHRRTVLQQVCGREEPVLHADAREVDHQRKADGLVR
eukprot:3382337-Prymnesium_polylepis.1